MKQRIQGSWIANALILPSPPQYHKKQWHLRLMSVVFNTFHQSYTFHVHQHPDHELILITAGEYQTKINHEPYSASYGQSILITPGDWHWDQANEQTKYIAFRFHLEIQHPTSQIQRISLLKSVLPAENHVFTLPPHFTSHIHHMLEQEGSCSSDLYSYFLLESIFQEIFWMLVRNIHPLHLSNEFKNLFTDESPFLRNLFNLFESHIGQPMTISQIAQKLHMSPSSLSHRCHKELKMGVQQAYSYLKIERAKELLLSTEMTIKEISEYLGFKNPYHFSRVFKHRCNESPRQFRQKKRLSSTS